jgi:hypothetical protein
MSPIEDMVIDACTDDYEDFEQIVIQVLTFARSEGTPEPQPSEIAAALRSLIAAAYVQAYRLGGERPERLSECPDLDNDSCYFLAAVSRKAQTLNQS